MKSILVNNSMRLYAVAMNNRAHYLTKSLSTNANQAWVSVRSPSSDSMRPVIFDSPHSGIRYPEDFRPIASVHDVKSGWDAHVDELLDDVVDTSGATLVSASFPRAYIDPNRSVSDIDVDMIADQWNDTISISDHCKRGMGLIRRFALPGVDMYPHKLSAAEVKRRIENYYKPYRDTLESSVQCLFKRYGTLWHFNCHSMKSRGNAMNVDKGHRRPDIVIGNRDNTTSSLEFAVWVQNYFSDLGYICRINDPYKGADIVRSIGNPDIGIQSVQIEINRALYMNEVNQEKLQHFAVLKKQLTRFSQVCSDNVLRE